MKSGMFFMLNRLGFSIFYLCIIIFASLAARRTDEILTPLLITNGANEMVQYFLPRRIELRFSPPEAGLYLPTFQGTPRFGAMIIRADRDSIVSIVVDESFDGIRKIFIDRNNDENLANDGDGSWGVRRVNYLETAAPVLVGFSSDYRAPLAIRFYRFDQSLPNVIFYYRDYFASGGLYAGDQRYAIMLLDDNADGRLSDLQNTTLVVDANQDEKLDTLPSSAEMFNGREPFLLGDESYVLREVSEDGRLAKFAVSAAKAAHKVRLEADSPAPEFSTTDFSGKSLKLSDYRGRVVLLYFWATWCKPCIAELPSLLELYREFGASEKNHDSKGDFEIIGVSLDQDREALKRFAESEQLPWPQLFDGGGWNMQIAQQYRVTSLPRTFLIDEKGLIRHVDLRGAALSEAVTWLMEKRIANAAFLH